MKIETTGYLNDKHPLGELILFASRDKPVFDDIHKTVKESKQVDITLIINGHEINIVEFFEEYRIRYEKYIEEKIKEHTAYKIDDRVGNLFEELESTINFSKQSLLNVLYTKFNIEPEDEDGTY